MKWIARVSGAVVLMAAVAFSASHAADLPRPSDCDADRDLRAEQEYRVFDPNFEQDRAQRVARTKLLLQEVTRREAAGQDTALSQQILWELKALLTQSADFRLIDRRIADLTASLAHPELESTARQQDPSDGSWGRGFSQWYCKLDRSYDEISGNAPIKYAPRFLDRVNSPEKLTAYLDSVSISNIPHDGVDHLLEFNLALTDLMRFILRDQPAGYAWEPRLKGTLMDLVLHQYRNRATGWWGERYVRGGTTVFIDDLSTTFHVVTYLHGNLPDLPLIMQTTLAVKEVNYPVGWLWKGQYWNHNNMDVVALFKACWRDATPEQKSAGTAEIDKMLRWCLTDSLQPDGSFKSIPADGSLEEGEYYGASFLARIGYFRKEERFWTHRQFPDAQAVRKRIVDYILQHKSTGGSGGGYYQSALEDCLDYKSSADPATR
jgi:hypothetical protein